MIDGRNSTVASHGTCQFGDIGSAQFKHIGLKLVFWR
jgi:hypothetical protein